MTSVYSMVGGILDGLANILNKYVVDPLMGFFNTYLAYIIGIIFYNMQVGLFLIIDAIQLVFRRAAGLDVYYYGNVEQEGDIVFSLLQDPTVQATFISILVAGIFLLFITTFIAVLKTEFDEKDNAKGPVFKSALKAIAYFAIVPVVSMLGIYVSNVVLKMLDGATSRDAESFTTSIFTAASYDANRARSDAEFAKYCYDKHKWIPGMNNLAEYDQARVASLIDQAFRGGYAPVATDSGTTTSAPQTSIANDSVTYDIMYNDTKLASASVTIKRGFTSGTISFSSFSITNYELVYYFYNPLSYNYIIGWIAGIAVAGILLNLLMGVIMRIFELSILFVLSPAAVALMPLDGGDRYKAWRGMFVKRVFSAYGPILGLNLVFMVLTLIHEIQFFPSGGMGGLYNALIYIVIMFAALASIKSLVDLVTELVGQGDALKQGQDVAKNTKALATKTIGQVGNLSMMPARAAFNVASRAQNKRNARRMEKYFTYNDDGDFDEKGKKGSTSWMLGTRFKGALAGLTENGRNTSENYKQAQAFKRRRAVTQEYLKNGGKVIKENGEAKRFGVTYHEGTTSVGKSLSNFYDSYVDNEAIEKFAKGFGKGAPIMGNIAKGFKGKDKEYDDMKKKAEKERKVSAELTANDEKAKEAKEAAEANVKAGAKASLHGRKPEAGSAAESPTVSGGGTAGMTGGQSTNNSAEVLTPPTTGGTPTTMNGAAPVTIQNEPTVRLANDNDDNEPSLDARISPEDNEWMQNVALNADEFNADINNASQDISDEDNEWMRNVAMNAQEFNGDIDTANEDIDNADEDANNVDVDAATTTTDGGEAEVKIDDAKLTQAINQVAEATNTTRTSIVNALERVTKEIEKNADINKTATDALKKISKNVKTIDEKTGSNKTKSGKNKR